MNTVGTRELVEQTRLPHARVSDYGDDLVMSLAGPVEGAAELVHLGVATDKARQTSDGGRL